MLNVPALRSNASNSIPVVVAAGLVAGGPCGMADRAALASAFYAGSAAVVVRPCWRLGWRAQMPFFIHHLSSYSGTEASWPLVNRLQDDYPEVAEALKAAFERQWG